MYVQRFPINPLIPPICSFLHYPQPHHNGTFVKTDEPTLTHHSHLNSIVYKVGYMFVFIHCMGLEKCIKYKYPHWKYHVKYLHHLKYFHWFFKINSLNFIFIPLNLAPRHILWQEETTIRVSYDFLTSVLRFYKVQMLKT